MPRLTTVLLLAVLAVTSSTALVLYRLNARIDGNVSIPHRVQTEVVEMSSMVYVTIVTGEIPGEPPIPTQITVTTNCEEEQGCAAAHRQAVVNAAAGLINVIYSTP